MMNGTSMRGASTTAIGATVDWTCCVYDEFTGGHACLHWSGARGCEYDCGLPSHFDLVLAPLNKLLSRTSASRHRAR
jgi:hypothetical protein